MYPTSCDHCGRHIANRREAYAHKYRNRICPASKSFSMLVVSNKVKAGELGVQLVQVNPRGGLSSSQNAVLNKIDAIIEAQTAMAKRMNMMPDTFVLAGLSVFFESQNQADLVALAGVIRTKKMDFRVKQDECKTRLDEMVQASEQVCGGDVAQLVQARAGYSMERMLIYHIRQRTPEQLEASAGFANAVYVAFHQSLIFAQVQDAMTHLSLVGFYIEEFISQQEKLHYSAFTGNGISPTMEREGEDVGRVRRNVLGRVRQVDAEADDGDDVSAMTDA